MYAVIETGGKQYRVSEGDVVRVERLDGDVGSEVTLEEIRLIGGDDTLVGAPVVEGAAVRATVVEQGRGPKVIAFKKKRRKGYRRKVGHRQPFTALRVDEIVAPGGGTSKSRAKAKKAKAPENKDKTKVEAEDAATGGKDE